jgi:GTP-binding protein HflX
VPYPVVAIVGYTNAGKSTLFNRITGSHVFAKQQVFATLDPTMREVRLKSGRRIILSDTVGFISDLPTMLVAAFRATLEEVADADLILHVRDISNPDHAAQADDVMKVLASLGVKPNETPIIEIRNKIDLLDANSPQPASVPPAGQVAATASVSAVTGAGVGALLDAIETVLAENSSTFRVTLPHTAGGDLGWLYTHAEIVARDEPDEAGTAMTVRIDPRHKAAFLRKFGDQLIRK